MTNGEFKCWMLGYFSLSNEEFLNNDQIKIIESHTNLVSTLEILEPSIQKFVDFLRQECFQHERRVAFEKARATFQQVCGLPTSA